MKNDFVEIGKVASGPAGRFFSGRDSGCPSKGTFLEVCRHITRGDVSTVRRRLLWSLFNRCDQEISVNLSFGTPQMGQVSGASP